MRSDSYLFLISCLLIWHLPSFSQVQDLQFKRLSTREGLSTELVITIVQDQQGFLWFGTMAGLNRYDGYGFKIFNNDPGDSTSISDDWINSLLVGHKGDLWIGTQNGGLNKYDHITETFTAYRNDPADTTSLADNAVASLCEDSKETIWIGTYNAGLCWKRASENIIRKFKEDSLRKSILTNTTINAIFEDSHGDLWVGTSQGLCRLNKDEKETGKYCLYGKDRFYPSLTKNRNGIKLIYKDSKGRLLIVLTSGEIYAYNPEKDEFRLYTFGLKPKDVKNIVAYSIAEDRIGRYWIGTLLDGIFLINPKDKSVRKFQCRSDDDRSISSNTIYSIYEDDAKNMWFGTFEGITSYDYRTNKFVSCSYRTNNPYGLNNGTVTDLCEDPDGGLWLATYGGGLNYLPFRSNRFIYYRHNQNDPSSISTDMLMCMAKIRDNVIWLGGKAGGLTKFDVVTKKAKNYFHDPNIKSSLSDNNIHYIYQDRSGKVWIGTANAGLDRLDPKTNKFINYRHEPNNGESLSGNNIWSIVEDSEGYIWVGTMRHGLNRLDPHTGKCIRFSSDQSNSISIPTNSIYALHEYPDGVLWIATTGGLCRLNTKTNELTTYSKKDGLANNGVGTILHDSKGRLWLSIKYLTMLDPQTHVIKNFDESDGIHCGEINQEAGFVGRDGRMYFGGSSGYVSFHPDSIYDNTYIPPVVLSNFRVFDKPKTLPKNYQTGVEFSYDENYFSFEFVALSFTATEKNMYRYKLEGFDNDWISSGTRRYTVYTNVQPGDYVFRVHGSNNDGVWNTKGTSIAIHIIPPFWKTLWFRLLVITALLSIIAFALRLRIRFLKERTRVQQGLSRKLLESQEEERKRIGAGLHDSIGQNLLVIKNLAIIGLEAGKNKQPTSEQLGEISQLASQSLSEVREISYNLRPYHLDQLGLTGALRSIISRIALSSQISFSEDLDDLNDLFLKEQEINIFRIVQEAVNNIIKHSRAKNANIIIKRDEGCVKFTMSDNGIGFDSSHKGFGLTGMAERVRILGGSLAVKSDDEVGTTITVIIPIRSEDGGD